MPLTQVRAQLLTCQVIPNVDRGMAGHLKLEPRHRALGLVSATIDDIGYTAVDEATKRAAVDVVYARSFYAGSGHASGPLSGEFIGIIAGPDPAEVQAGLRAVQDVMEGGACFYALDPECRHCFFPHVIPRTGTYLSHVAGIAAGEPLAYLIAPPVEAMMGLDAALKAADVKLQAFYGPPTETNFGGGLLTGTVAACQAAAEAFRDAVVAVAANPRKEY